MGDIPSDMLKVTLNIHLLQIMKIINLSFENGYFPDDLKLSEVSPIFKNSDDYVKHLWKNLNYSYIDAFMQDKLSNPLTGLWKNHSTQHCSMYMYEYWENMLDKGGYVLCSWLIKGLWHNIP